MQQAVVRKLESVAAGIYLEGLAIDCDRGYVWYSDVIAGGVYGRGPGGSLLSCNSGRMWSGGVILNSDGSVLSSGAGGIMWNDPASGESQWLISEIDGVAINGINEMAPDGEGGIFFGTCDVERVALGEAPRPTAIYRLTVDRDIIQVADNIGFSNGIMYDPERKKFYCNDTFNCTWVFDVGSDLTLRNRSVLMDKDDADGMVLDADGNVWITGFRSGHLTRVSPDGTALSSVVTPVEAITQVRFGGADMKDIYLNTVPATGGDDLKAGAIPTEKSSVLYRGRCSIAGMRLAPVHLSLA